MSTKWKLKDSTVLTKVATQIAASVEMLDLGAVIRQCLSVINEFVTIAVNCRFLSADKLSVLDFDRSTVPYVVVLEVEDCQKMTLKFLLMVENRFLATCESFAKFVIEFVRTSENPIQSDTPSMKSFLMICINRLKECIAARYKLIEEARRLQENMTVVVEKLLQHEKSLAFTQRISSYATLGVSAVVGASVGVTVGATMGVPVGAAVLAGVAGGFGLVSFVGVGSGLGLEAATAQDIEVDYGAEKFHRAIKELKEILPPSHDDTETPGLAGASALSSSPLSLSCHSEDPSDVSSLQTVLNLLNEESIHQGTIDGVKISTTDQAALKMLGEKMKGILTSIPFLKNEIKKCNLSEKTFFSGTLTDSN